MTETASVVVEPGAAASCSRENLTEFSLDRHDYDGINGITPSSSSCSIASASPSPVRYAAMSNGKTVFIARPLPTGCVVTSGGQLLRATSGALYKAIKPQNGVIPTISGPFRPRLPLSHQSPTKIVYNGLRPVLRPVIRVIQPANYNSCSNSPPKAKVSSSSSETAVANANVAQVPKRVVQPPRDYPGDNLAVFVPCVEKPARCIPVSWRTYRETYSAACKAEVTQKVLKPWDIRYQPITSKQRAARTVLQPSPEKEKPTAVKTGVKRKLMEVKPEFPSVGKFHLPTAKVKVEPKDDETSEEEECNLFTTRSADEEYRLTMNTKNFNAEDAVYTRLACERLLNDNHFQELDNIAKLDVREPIPGRKMPKLLPFRKLLLNSCENNQLIFSNTAEVETIKEGKVRYVDPEIRDVRPTKSGCARTEPYEKNKCYYFLSPVKPPVDGRRFIDITEEEEEELKASIKQSKFERLNLRTTLTQIEREIPEISKRDSFKVNNIQNQTKNLKLAKSPIHGFGLFAMTAIQPDSMIIEYCGEKIRHEVANIREKRYEKEGIGSSYMFRLDDKWVIDATKMGNVARYINHCCVPNCYARVIGRGDDKRILIFSKCIIEKGEELTYDYKFELEETKISCHCGARGCRTYLN